MTIEEYLTQCENTAENFEQDAQVILKANVIKLIKTMGYALDDYIGDME